MIKKMEQLVEDIRPLFDAVQWEDPAVYANWLSQSYYIASRSTSFLGLCLFHANKFPQFQARCAEHIAEETGHELLIENDLKHLGHKMHAELPSTMLMYQTQYFRIVAESPLSFLGYVFFLETLGPKVGEGIMARAGLTNPRALSFLKVHTRADEGHLEKAVEIFKGLPEQYHADMWTNFHMSREAYVLMLKDVARLGALKKKSA